MTGNPEPDTQDLARSLIAEMRQELGTRGERSTRVVIASWLRRVALGTIALLVVLDATLLFGDHDTVGERAPSRVVAQFQLDACAQRQAQIMRALDAYRQKHGEAPALLTMLGPPDLTAPPVDPDSNRPYIYLHSGEQVAIECPNPDLHNSNVRAANDRR
ncbi:MAG TPA: hypothetical protein VMT89_17535 [Candidatus Acidoferrales bacterium]|nr:hypothetical protein [Candidatus Acidoferrales bacterium]